ncbi:MAG: DeoR/GlpR transcriptional regulator [Lewinellaceae bacterium]|nr:DeoR/GlpR transcriptional regulator [Saprospiraceae bacterium]MCB0543236.1 DeoR/GlpR transcriptional regulator [Saprospiraceae bacterium]MCB9353869.1 DeoR/GlpR transcriptional regulator [Lewinellaceae bacterium]
MLKKERQALILREVNIHNKVSHGDLSEQLGVSEDTVRRDLQELADQDLLVKVRGGAISRSFHIYSYKENQIYAYQEKTTIAQKAISLLRDGMLVLISGGTTNLEVARILPPELKATFCTVSLPTALQLAEHPSSDTIFIGGRISSSAQISTGGEVIRKLADLRPDLCLLGANSIDPEAGVTDSDWDVVEVKQMMVSVSKKVAALAISEKLNSAQKMKVCSLAQLDYLLTELEPHNPLLKPYQVNGLHLF